MKFIKDENISTAIQNMNFDFNSFVSLLDRNNFKTILMGNYMPNFIFDNPVCLEDVQQDIQFREIFNTCESTLNKTKRLADLHLFCNFTSGGKGAPHVDTYGVYLIGLLGKTLYRNPKEEFIVSPCDILHIEKGEEHRAIGLTPRIILSYGFR